MRMTFRPVSTTFFLAENIKDNFLMMTIYDCFKEDFKQCLASLIEFYNTQRSHRTLKNRTPCQMEDTFMSDK